MREPGTALGGPRSVGGSDAAARRNGGERPGGRGDALVAVLGLGMSWSRDEQRYPR